MKQVGLLLWAASLLAGTWAAPVVAQAASGGATGRFAPTATVTLRAHRGSPTTPVDVLMREGVQRWILAGTGRVAHAAPRPAGKPRLGNAGVRATVSRGLLTDRGVPLNAPAGCAAAWPLDRDVRWERAAGLGIVQVRRVCTSAGPTPSPGREIACDTATKDAYAVRIEAF